MNRNIAVYDVHKQAIWCASPSFVVFGLNRFRLALLTVASGVAHHLYAWFAFSRRNATIDAGHEVLDPLYGRSDFDGRVDCCHCLVCFQPC